MTSGDAGRPYLLVVAAAVAVAFAARAVPLYWSPLPATLDGFRYARLAATTLAAGELPFAAVAADEFVFTLGLAATSVLTGVRPVAAAQPFVVTAGAATPLVAVAFVRRLGVERNWSARRVRAAAALAALALALEGLYLRRTGVPDEEALGLLLVPLLALAVHRLLAAGRPAWGGVVLALVAVLPPLHNLSALVGLLTVAGLAVLHALRSASARTAVLGAALALGFAGYFFGYFEAATRLGLDVTYSGLLRDYPGLFVAWVVVLLVGLAWFRSTTARARRAAVLAPIGLWFLVVAVNAVRPVFPGTVTSPPAIVGMVAALAVPVAYAGWLAPVLGRGTGLAVLAVLAAPVVLVFYTLTAALTPEFFDAVVRVQTFAHPSVLVLGALTAVGVGHAVRTVPTRVPQRAGRALLVGLFVVALAVTVPLGYVNLDTATGPSTTFESEFEAAGFAATRVDGAYATDHTLSRVGAHYFPGPGSGTYGPTRQWAMGGPAPSCPVLAQRSWTTTGAHLYPAQPGVVEPRRYERLVTHAHRGYDVGGFDPVVLAVPRTTAGRC